MTKFQYNIGRGNVGLVPLMLKQGNEWIRDTVCTSQKKISLKLYVLATTAYVTVEGKSLDLHDNV